MEEFLYLITLTRPEKSITRSFFISILITIDFIRRQAITPSAALLSYWPWRSSENDLINPAGTYMQCSFSLHLSGKQWDFLCTRTGVL